MNTYRDYLQKTFLEELNYKIWSTKGSRFNASKRLLALSRISNLSNNFLSVYLTTVGLMSVYNIYSPNLIRENTLAYSITSLSILALVFGQIENAKDYNIKARDHHNCGLELSSLYNDLRIFKTLRENPTIAEKEQFAKEVSASYQGILARYDNHELIDIDCFKILTAPYHELSSWQVFKIKVRYSVGVFFIYYFLIIVPPLIILLLLIMHK